MRCAGCDLILIGPGLCLFCGDVPDLGPVERPAPPQPPTVAAPSPGRSKPIRPSLGLPVGLGVCLFGLVAACAAVVVPDALAPTVTIQAEAATSGGGIHLHTAGLGPRGHR